MAQGPHGELVEVSVTGAQELVAAADAVSPSKTCHDPGHGARRGWSGSGAGSNSKLIRSMAVSEAVRPGPARAAGVEHFVLPRRIRA